MGLFRQNSLLGLDIGSHSIKLVEVKHTRGGPVITCAKAVPIAREQEGDTEYVADIAIGEALRELLGKSKLRSRRVITAVSSALEEQVTILPTFFIPDLVQDLPKETIKASVMAEAEVQARIPFSADVAVTDCNVLEEKTIGGKRGLEVFFVVVHRDLIDSRFQLLRSVGLIPIAIDVDFLALARLLGFTNQIPDDEDVAIIDIGAFKTSVGFYQHGRLHIYPHVSVAGDILTDEVSQQLSISWEEAEERKKKAGCGVPTPTPPEEGKEVQDAEFGNSVLFASFLATHQRPRLMVTSEPEEQLEDSASEVIQWTLEGSSLLGGDLGVGRQGLYPQLQSRFDFYEADFPDFKLSKIFSAGGTSQLLGLNNFLASRLLIPVENVSYLENIPVDAKGDVSEIKNNEPLFATAVGLALKKKL